MNTSNIKEYTEYTAEKEDLKKHIVRLEKDYQDLKCLREIQIKYIEYLSLKISFLERNIFSTIYKD